MADPSGQDLQPISDVYTALIVVGTVFLVIGTIYLGWRAQLLFGSWLPL